MAFTDMTTFTCYAGTTAICLWPENVLPMAYSMHGIQPLPVQCSDSQCGVYAYKGDGSEDCFCRIHFAGTAELSLFEIYRPPLFTIKKYSQPYAGGSNVLYAVGMLLA